MRILSGERAETRLSNGPVVTKGLMPSALRNIHPVLNKYYSLQRFYDASPIPVASMDTAKISIPVRQNEKNFRRRNTVSDILFADYFLFESV
ncbi:MAG: hypothetical protein AAF724_17690 [Pseudomonadota bacterium]